MANSAHTNFNESDEDFCSLLSEEDRELMSTQTLESDLDFAFHLQLEEAINASLSLIPSSSSVSPQTQTQTPTPITVPIENDPVVSVATPITTASSLLSKKVSKLQQITAASSLLSEEVSELQQELNDLKKCEIEMRKMREDLDTRIFGKTERVAREILTIPDRLRGDNLEKPFGEGSSKHNENDDSDSIFRLYFKGLVSEEKVRGDKVILAGIGVAICDPDDNLVLEIKKPLIGNGMGKNATEFKAFIEGLNAALSLDLRRIFVFCDYYPLYQFVMRIWTPKQKKIAMLVQQVSRLQRQFVCCNLNLVARNNIKYAFKFARDAIVSQLTGPAGSSHVNTLNENCVICLEDTDVERIFSVDGCQHRYCFSCMKQHVEVKLLHGMVPKCPHESCKSDLNVDSCRKFLTSKLIETMRQCIREASIPVTEKIYCPYPKCSALMSKGEVAEYTKSTFVGAGYSVFRKCLKCHGLFCIDCKVPWHSGMTCNDYKRLNPNPPVEDVKLKSLATRNLWRQCVKCNHMIELAEGCYHMTCRCGFEFCYNCGAEWKNKSATCSCPLWDEDNIWYVDGDSSDEEEEDIIDEYEYTEYDDSDSDEYFY